MQQGAEYDIEIEVTKLVGVLAASYPSVQMSAASIKVYVAMLKDIPVEVLKASVEQCIAESEFLPTIAKLRDKAFVLMSNVSQMPSPFEAWGIVVKEIQRPGRGYNHSGKFDNEIIAKAVDCIGWRELCMSENQVADRAHFAKVYTALVERAVSDAKMLPAARQIQQQATRLITSTGVH